LSKTTLSFLDLLVSIHLISCLMSCESRCIVHSSTCSATGLSEGSSRPTMARGPRPHPSVLRLAIPQSLHYPT